MFCRNILLNSKILNSLSCIRQNYSIISPYFVSYSVLKHLHIQSPNSQNEVNYSKNLSNDFSDKPSQTLIFCKYLRLIKSAIREFGPVVEINPKLARAIENAKKNNVPIEFIQFARKISCDNRANIGLFDLLLPNGCHFLIQYDDIDSTITKYHLLKLCDKFDGTLFQGETIWPRSFDQKGLILVKCVDGDPLLSAPKQIILKLGVESYKKVTDPEGVEYWKFCCNPWQLHKVKKQLHEITTDVDEAYVGFFPKRKIKLAKHNRSSVFNVFQKLCEVPTIDHVYINMDLNL